MAFTDKWPLFGGYFVLFYQGQIIEGGVYLDGGLYSEVAFNTGLTVYRPSKTAKHIFIVNIIIGMHL